MKIEKTTKKEEKPLSEIGFKIVDLKTEIGDTAFYPFLEEDLTEVLKEKLKEKKIKVISDLKVYYDLSYSQGSGFCFVGDFEFKNCVFRIEHNFFYYHEHSTNINLITYKDKDWFDLTKKQEEIAQKIEKEFINLYISICREVRDFGYSIIEEEEKTQILKIGFEDFLNENGLSLNSICELFDLDYSETEKEGFIKICDSGDTSLKGLWIEDIKVKIEDKVKAEITEYTERTI